MSKDKILFIGSYKESTGWGQAARDYLLALDAAGLNVVCRPLKLGTQIPYIPSRIRELEAKDTIGCNICIQNVLPHLMDFNGGFSKNIGLCFLDTDSVANSSWPTHLNQMDGVWVSNSEAAMAAIKSGVTKPISIVPCATNVEKFEQNYEPLPLPGINGDFVFYTIGDLTRRKNLPALISAFHLEFSPNEPVALVLKSTKFNVHPKQVIEEVMKTCETIKHHLRLYPSVDHYKNELVLGDYLSETDLYRLHATCNCFVMPSYGEGWCIPAFDALGFGKTPICTAVGGMKDYLRDLGLTVHATSEPVSGIQDTFSDLFTGQENWKSIDVRNLQEKMRGVYDLSRNSVAYAEFQSKCVTRAFEYSYEKVGELMKYTLQGGK